MAKVHLKAGKGHEVACAHGRDADVICIQAENLDRILKQYQLWAHNLFPPSPFAEAVRSIEVSARPT